MAGNSPNAVERAIAVLAARQHGNVTRQQLLRIGLGEDAIEHRVKTGRLFRVHRGVYAVGHPPRTPLEKAAAAVLACGPGAVLSHSSAMVQWGFWKRWEWPLEVTVALDRRPAGIRVHRSRTLAWRDARSHLGIRVTAPARTLLDIAPRLSEEQLRRTVNDALHTPWLTHDQLAQTVCGCSGQPAAERVVRLIGTSDGPSRSDWEDAFPAFCEKHGLPRPRMNVPLLGYTVDALFEAEKLIVELDGWAFHSGRHAFESDRERDATTLVGGFPTVRITWERMHGQPRREAARLHEILAERRGKAA